jgi:predicted nucleotidyltransferase
VHDPSQTRLIEVLQQHLASRPEILDAYLFGSHARGDAVPRSDVDVAVFLDTPNVPEAPFGYPAELSTELATALGVREVDVVILNEAPPLLYHRVLRDGIRLTAQDLAATTTREGRAYSRYCDFLPVLRRMDALHADRTRRGEFGR